MLDLIVSSFVYTQTQTVVRHQLLYLVNVLPQRLKQLDKSIGVMLCATFGSVEKQLRLDSLTSFWERSLVCVTHANRPEYRRDRLSKSGTIIDRPTHQKPLSPC